MSEVLSDRSGADDDLDPIVRALAGGMILVDASGEVAWMDERTRRGIDGELERLQLPLSRGPHAVECFASTVEVTIGGERRRLCVLQATAEQAADGDFGNLIAAIEDVMADPSWLTHSLIDKLKAWRQASKPSIRASDLELLTTREREILALICQGRTDVEMGRLLNLSQNTVRNHVASLFRKVGVNRRSAAVIWARERAITSHEVLAFSAHRRNRREQE